MSSSSYHNSYLKKTSSSNGFPSIGHIFTPSPEHSYCKENTSIENIYRPFNST